MRSSAVLVDMRRGGCFTAGPLLRLQQIRVRRNGAPGEPENRMVLRQVPVVRAALKPILGKRRDGLPLTHAFWAAGGSRGVWT